MKDKIHIKTARLEITEFDPLMARRIHELSVESDNRRYLPDEVFESEEEAQRAIKTLMSFYRGGGPIVCPVLFRSEPIGHVEAAPLSGGEWEIGYHIGKDYTGRGFAAETVEAFAPFIMNRLGIGRIFGICRAENTQSRRVLEKCGFMLEFDGMGTYQDIKTRISRYRRDVIG